MLILHDTAEISQLRCRAFRQRRQPYHYEIKVLGRWVPCNYPFARWVVDTTNTLRKSNEEIEK